ncbi:MAG: HU family DNA-binding protein [Candidatus Riflebacteria bacterium]|nr:HU family DNA-binding protein [Candidatus Riflebacteria bacterium]
MNKHELAQIIAKDVELTHAQAAATIDAFTGAIQKALKKGEDVTLVGFGTFKTKKRAARMGVNPQTKAKMKIPAKKVVKFVVGKALKTAV